jgi:prolyl-tRNA editing enzyme YbaK/EbsC (Cys-tRNA(Pro) deacylase)
MESLTNKVKETLSLSTHEKVQLPVEMTQHVVSHAPTTNAASWKEALASSAAPSEGYNLTKTLVFKPKVAKTETAVLIVVVALDDTATLAGQIAKAAGVKEARFATGDAVQEVLGVTVEEGIALVCWVELI